MYNSEMPRVISAPIPPPTGSASVSPISPVGFPAQPNYEPRQRMSISDISPSQGSSPTGTISPGYYNRAYTYAPVRRISLDTNMGVKRPRIERRFSVQSLDPRNYNMVQYNRLDSVIRPMKSLTSTWATNGDDPIMNEMRRYSRDQIADLKRTCISMIAIISKYEVSNKLDRRRNSLTVKRRRRKLRTHGYSKSDTMASSIDAELKLRLQQRQEGRDIDISKAVEDNGQLCPGESILLKVEPFQPNRRSSLNTKFIPQGVLHQDLSVKPRIKCMQCGSGNTPEWRKGPENAPTLCNACGLFHKKLVKKLGEKGAAEFLERKRSAGKPSERIVRH